MGSYAIPFKRFQRNNASVTQFPADTALMGAMEPTITVEERSTQPARSHTLYEALHHHPHAKNPYERRDLPTSITSQPHGLLAFDFTEPLAQNRTIAWKIACAISGIVSEILIVFLPPDLNTGCTRIRRRRSGTLKPLTTDRAIVPSDNINRRHHRAARISTSSSVRRRPPSFP